MTTEACVKQIVPRPSVQVAYECFHPAAHSGLRRPQGPLPLQTTPIANLEWASAFLDQAAYLIKTREQKYEELAKQYNLALDTIGHQNTNIHNLKTKNAKLDHKIEHLHADVACLELTHKRLDEAFDHFRSRAKKEKAVLTKELEDTRRKLSAALSDDVKDHKAIESLHQALEKETKENALLQEKLDGKIKELLQTQQKLQATKDEQSLAAKDIARLNAEIEKLKQDLADRDRTISRQGSDLEQLRQANAALDTEKSQLSTTLTSKTAELAAAQAKISELNVSSTEQKKRITMLEIELKHSKAQYASLLTRSEEEYADLVAKSKKEMTEHLAMLEDMKKHHQEDHKVIDALNLDRELHQAGHEAESRDAEDKSKMSAMLLEAEQKIKKGLDELEASKKEAEAANQRALDASQKASDAEAQRKSAEAAIAKAALDLAEAHKALLPNDVKLANPIALVGSLKGAPRNVDDETFYINCSFPVTLFNVSSSKIYISSNGLFTLNHASTEYNYKKFPYRGWLTNILPDHVLAPFWADLYIFKSTPQGIYYEETGSAPNRKLEIEWYVSRYQEPKQYYHFSLVVEEAKPNMATFKYFEALDKGKKCTIGIQGPNTSTMFSYNQEKALPGTQVTFNTAKNTFTASTFDISKSAAKPAVKGSAVRDVKPANAAQVTVTPIVDF